MRTTFIIALVLAAYLNAASPARRQISVPAPIKNAFGQVWGAVKGDVNTLKSCMVKAAKGAAMKLVASALPANAASMIKMLGVGRRMGFLGNLANKAKNMAKKGACAAFGAKGLAMCKSGVAAGVSKGANMLKSKLKKLDTKAASACLKTFGNALCDKAYKKACGRRMIAIPAPIKKAFSAVYGALKGDLNNLKSCVIKAAKGAAMKLVTGALPANAGAMIKMLGVGRRMGFLGNLANKAKNMAKKGACAAFGAKGLALCKSGVKAGVAKGANMLKSKLKKLDTKAASACLTTFGNALCDKAYKKACGRRL